MKRDSVNFAGWCTDNNRQDILDRWDYELNVLSPYNIAKSGNGKKYYFKCPLGIHNSELKSVNNFTQGHEGVMDCCLCNSIAQYGIDNYGEDFIEKYWSDKNTTDPWNIKKFAKSFIWIKCQEKDYHNDYKLMAGDFIIGKRCPYCSGKKTHKLDSIGYIFPQVFNIWSNMNTLSPYDYLCGSHKKVWCKCENETHNDYIRSIKDIIYCDFKCPECIKLKKESKLQDKVHNYLNSLNYTINNEHNCSIVPINPKTKHKLPFDNEIYEIKLIIEVHGKQHYDINSYTRSSWLAKNMSPIEAFNQRKLYDRYKKAVAECNSYFYLEIPYYCDDKKESYKTLIDNKIKVIVNED